MLSSWDVCVVADLHEKRKNMKKDQIVIMTLAGVLIIGSIEEMGKHKHCHEGTYETTSIVRTCVPFVTGSYVPAKMSEWNS